MNHRKGFTLIEVIVILGVIAILAAIAVPLALRIFERTAEDATREELANLEKAMIGDPRKLQSSFRSDFGFLGDIGRIPANLDEILIRGSLPAFTFDTSRQAGAGWKGPYITGAAAGEEAEDFKKDQWGNDYSYSDADFTNANGEAADGKITSAGPDGVLGTADDIVLEILKNETTATVRGSVKDSSGVGLGGISVEFYSAVNAVLTTTTATTDGNGNYSFISAPFGPRSVNAKPTLAFVSGSVVVSGGANNNITFKVANYSANPVTITDMNVVCSGTGATRYDDIEINNNPVDSGNNHPCGTVLNITDTTIAANPTPPAPLRVFVDSPDTQLPDVTVKGGTQATIELIDFEDSRGRNVDMRGKTITVTFLNSGTTLASFTFATP